ncbi:TPA: tyrosine-type recombinase/integrase [Proteus mirabilis]|nr:tyrosine-type recombinase/integrase [Proteus mirabilis]HEK3255916.1 tyrosine-type recombinase/integrase [Proteus mirabilis]
MGRSRSAKNKGLPPNLYLRKGIYYYRDVRTKKEFSVGSNKSLAITEAIQANLAIYKPKESLVDRINNVHCVTLHEWLDKYQDGLKKRGLRKKTLYDYNSKIKIIKLNIADAPLNEITTKDIASFISNYSKRSMAKLMRVTLLDAFNEAIAEGLLNENPVSVTRAPKTQVNRARLTLDDFNYAINHTNKKYKNLFLLALLTAQRISDIENMKWSDIKNDRIHITQIKTGAKISIPTSLKIDAVNVSIKEVLGNIEKKGDFICGVKAQSIRKAFLQSLPQKDNMPTFHEIRSLSARLYEDEKGAEFAKKILGHKSMQMTDRYLDNRGSDYIEL